MPLPNETAALLDASVSGSVGPVSGAVSGSAGIALDSGAFDDFSKRWGIIIVGVVVAMVVVRGTFKGSLKS